MYNFYYNFEDQLDDEVYETELDKIDYGDGNYKKSCPSLDEYDGNETQQY